MSEYATLIHEDLEIVVSKDKITIKATNHNVAKKILDFYMQIDWEKKGLDSSKTYTFMTLSK
jgi:hypothetical protein